MSGGSWEYAYGRVEEVADRLVAETDEHPLRQQLGHHLRKVAKALHDVEWVDSGDYGPGDELAAIREVLGRSEPEAHPTRGRLVWGIVRNAGRTSTERKARWAHVRDATGLGSTSAAALCRQQGLDPDEEVGAHG